MSYERQAPNYATAEEFEPVRQAQLDAARRLYRKHPREMEALLKRSTKSDDPLTFAIGFMLAVRLGLPRAGRWVNTAEQRLRQGKPQMRPHPVLEEEGTTTEEYLIDGLQLLKKELRSDD